MLGGTLGCSDQGAAGPAFPLPNCLGKSAQLLGWVLHPQRSPLGCVGPGGIGKRPGENRRGRREGPSRTRGAGKEQRAFALPTWAQGVCCTPRLISCPPRLISCPPKPSPGHVGPGGIEGRLGRSGEAGERDPLELEERRTFAPPTRAQEAFWGPRWSSLPSETRGGGMPGPLLFC